MSKHYNKHVLCEHYRCFTITELRPLGDSEWYHCYSELEAMFSAVLGNGRKIKGRVRIAGDTESTECTFYIGDAQIPYDDSEDSYTAEAYAAVSNIARKMRATESCIYELYWDIRHHVQYNIPKRDYNSEILPRVPRISWINLQVENASDYDQYDQFIGSADLSLRLPDGEKEASVTVHDFSFGPEYGSRVFSAMHVDGRSYHINYGTMDDSTLLSGTDLYMALHTAEKEIGIPWGTLMPIIKRVQQRLMYRLDSV